VVGTSLSATTASISTCGVIDRGLMCAARRLPVAMLNDPLRLRHQVQYD
jgi:hypothetical protein